MRYSRQSLIVVSACTLCAGIAHASTEYLVEDSDVDIRLANGTTFDLELYLTLDENDDVEKVSFKGYAFNDHDDPVDFEIDFGASTLHDLSDGWTYDGVLDPKLSATDSEGQRATRVTHRDETHVIEWAFANERITVVIEDGVGDYLEQEGLLVGNATQDFDGVLATVLAVDAGLGAHVDDGETTGIEDCFNYARQTCALDCDGDGIEDTNCINSLVYDPDSGFCMFGCYLEEQCCGS